MTHGSLCAETDAKEADCLPSACQTYPDQTQPDTSPLSTSICPLCTIVYDPKSNGFATLQAEWNKLLQRSRYNTIFLTYEWQTTWWECLGEGNLWIVAFHRADTHELVGIAPLYLVTPSGGRWAGKRKLNLVGCIEVSDYLDIIVAKDWEKAVYRAFYSWLCSSEAPAWDVLELCNLPQDSRTYQEFHHCVDQGVYTVEISQEDVAPQFVLPLHYETYLQEHVEKKQRHEIRRKQRRAERETTVNFYYVTPQDNLVAEIDDFVALQQASREDKAEFMTPEMRYFFGKMAQRMQDAGWLRLCFLTINGEKAAALLGFEYNKRYLLYNSGYDPESYPHLSPGWVLVAYAIQYAIAVGDQVFDFMQGNEEYKYRFGSRDYAVMRVLVSRQA
jgi:CelD/BcsL family acetyltransferase involved in cellulose biosynthesis